MNHFPDTIVVENFDTEPAKRPWETQVDSVEEFVSPMSIGEKLMVVAIFGMSFALSIGAVVALYRLAKGLLQ